MSDPVVTLLASGTSTTATTTVSFAAQPAGTRLVLVMVGDDYRTTSGSGRPEGNGWTLPSGTGFPVQANLGLYLWHKSATGSETSVQYTIGSASHSAYQVYALTNIDATTPLQIIAGTSSNGTGFSFATPSLAPSVGRRLAFGVMATSSGGDNMSSYSWSGGYTANGATFGPSTHPQMSIGAASLALTGDGTTTTTSTVTFSSDGVNAGSILAIFEVAAGSSTPSGTGALGVAWASSSHGSVAHNGSGTEHVAWAASGAGSVSHSGSGALGVAWAAHGAGSAIPGGSGALGVAWHAAAAGQHVSNGSGALDIAWDAVATGSAPVVGSASGSGALSIAWQALATGQRASNGAGALDIAWDAVANGEHVSNGSGALDVAWAALASGVAPTAVAAPIVVKNIGGPFVNPMVGAGGSITVAVSGVDISHRATGPNATADLVSGVISNSPVVSGPAQQEILDGPEQVNPAINGIGV